MDELLDLDLRQVALQLKQRKVSPVELARITFARLREQEPKITAYACFTEARAMAAAQQAEREIVAGRWRGEMHGVPVAVKDLYDMGGLPTTCSSKVRHDHIASQDSACVERLEQAGAVIVGKTHTHEFAYGAATPTTGNPWDPTRIPGGSSGGSGATVAARGCYMAMGTDTGGSIRIPSALCGTVGLKPTFGRVSRHGIASLSWSLDHAGPLARTVADAAVTLGAVAGYDPRDNGSADVPVADYLAELEHGVRGLRIGVPKNYYFDLLDPEVEKAAREAIAQLGREGATLVEVDIPMADKIMAVEFGILLPEASAYHQKMLRERGDLYQPDARALLEMGEFIPATDYIAALRVRGQVKAAWQRLFQDGSLDGIVAPTVPVPALPRDQDQLSWPDGTVEQAIDAFVRLMAPCNITGLPSLALPSGFSDEGLPLSIQVIGRPFQEARVLRIGRAYERANEWGSRRPEL